MECSSGGGRHEDKRGKEREGEGCVWRGSSSSSSTVTSDAVGRGRAETAGRTEGRRERFQVRRSAATWKRKSILYYRRVVQRVVSPVLQLPLLLLLPQPSVLEAQQMIVTLCGIVPLSVHLRLAETVATLSRNTNKEGPKGELCNNVF